MTEEEIKNIINSAIAIERKRIKDKIGSLPVYGTRIYSDDNQYAYETFISHDDMKMFLESLIDIFGDC